eukprot:TRINITY_DN2622_c0_g1_i1.p1 TRINITY_DN2622_c0_g1~~TRINITY_DN2622_c0_g1_i1.p1  ORF type:complete len:532 (-),score=51.73 TRINITY_DN2622_c0_g1_i1:303-1898(-)
MVSVGRSSARTSKLIPPKTRGAPSGKAGGSSKRTDGRQSHVMWFIIWTVIYLSGAGAAFLLAYSPDPSSHAFLRKFLKIRDCPSSETLLELSSRRQECDTKLQREALRMNLKKPTEQSLPYKRDLAQATASSTLGGAGLRSRTQSFGTGSQSRTKGLQMDTATREYKPKRAFGDDEDGDRSHRDSFSTSTQGSRNTYAGTRGKGLAKQEGFGGRGGVGRVTSGGAVGGSGMKEEVGHADGIAHCKASLADWTEFTAKYTHEAVCPDDWKKAQMLMFLKDCFDLPKRDCFSPFIPGFREPWPQHEALWVDPNKENVDWKQYPCDSYECLRKRTSGDCRECFDWTAESKRWTGHEETNLNMDEVVALKQGLLRIGLDVAGGTGSFAARMAPYNVTIISTGMNTFAPFLETMAGRGLPALHLPMKARLPFFDYSLDIIHSVHAVQMLTLTDFEFMLYDWDRVLRPGGLIWLEKLYFPTGAIMKQYVDVLTMLSYKHHFFSVWKHNGQVKLTCVIEKPLRPNKVRSGTKVTFRET